MRNLRFPIIGFLFAIIAFPAISQTWSISGNVCDSITRKPLAFVSILINNSNQGGCTDIDGVFLVKCSENPLYLRLSYVGYKPAEIILNGKTKALNIFLAPANNELSGITILPGDNPAHRIIRQVIENRKLNDPEQMHSFKYHCYNKITAEWYPNENYYAARAKWENDSTKADSTLIKLAASADTQNIMILESYTDRIFQAPAKSKETVLGTKVSGFKDPNFSTIATDVQPFSFYSDEIKMNLGTVTDYLNPVGKGGIGHYGYLIEDTLYDGVDSIYIISFHPLNGKTFNALKGIIYINTNGYAIQNVIAEPAEEGLWKIKIQQQYRYIDGKHWFPEQLNYDWILPHYPSQKMGVMLKGRSYINDIQLNPEINPRDFGPDKILLADSAGKRGEAFWSASRNDTLTLIEKNTYTVVDEMGRKAHFDYYNRAIPAIIDGFLPIGPIDISYDKLYSYNSYEGSHLGLGLRTGEKIAKWFHLGGYFGYGFKDKAWKYGGDILFRLWRKHDLELYGSYSYDLEEPGVQSFYKYRNAAYWFGMIGQNFELNKELEAGFRFRTFKFLEGEVAMTRSEIDPCYTYIYHASDGFTDTSFVMTEARIGLRYSVRDEVADAFGRRVSMGSRYPVFYATYTYGFPDLLGGEYEYSKLEIAASKEFHIRNFGKMSLLAEAGTIWGDVPYPKLFRGKASYGGDISFLIQNSFQTMRVDEFASDRYINFFFRHNFGTLLFKAGKFKPEFTIANNLSLGTLSHPELHDGLSLKAPSKGFYEAGLIIDNLIRLKILNIAYVGLGIGTYYRYGPYSFDKTLDNFAFKISFRISGN
jgi:hypothetical protein